MIVDNLDVERADCPTGPFEANAPLHVDPNAELAGTVALESFETVASQRSQIVKAGRRVKDLEPSIGLLRKSLEFSNVASCRERRGSIIPVTLDHAG